MGKRTLHPSASASLKKVVFEPTRSGLGLGPEHFDRKGLHDAQTYFF
jgi:hypothetical protein